MARTIVIAGGGIAGLSIAAALLDEPDPPDVTVLESSARAGGAIRSTREAGFLYEWGPTGFLDDAPATIELAGRSGLGDRLTRAGTSAARRFVVRRGRARELPHGALGFLASSVLSARGRLRMLGEPFVPPRRDTSDESVLDFAARRIGREAAEVLVDALVTGIWAGDSRRLSVVSAFPKLVALEREHGGLVRGMLAKKRRGGPAGPSGTLASFPGGLEELPGALARRLGPSLRLGERVVGVEPSVGVGWRVAIDGGITLEADAVILAIPSWAAATVLAGIDRGLGDRLAAIPWVGVAVAHLGFEAAEAAPHLQGFGALAPRGETASLLGVLVPSNIFPDRAPAGCLLATAMLGGARDPSIVEKDDRAIVAKALAEIASFTGLRAEPRFTRVIRHARAIPQYDVGHAENLAAIDAAVSARPGLHLAGNSYRGIAINACVAGAGPVARAALSFP